MPLINKVNLINGIFATVSTIMLTTYKITGLYGYMTAGLVNLILFFICTALILAKSWTTNEEFEAPVAEEPLQIDDYVVIDLNMEQIQDDMI